MSDWKDSIDAMLDAIPDTPPEYDRDVHGILAVDIAKSKCCDLNTARRKADKLCADGTWERVLVRIGRVNGYAYRPRRKAAR